MSICSCTHVPKEVTRAKVETSLSGKGLKLNCVHGNQKTFQLIVIIAYSSHYVVC